MTEPRPLLLSLFHTGLLAVNGDGAVFNHLAGWDPEGPVVVLAVGKAAQAMAIGASRVLGGWLRGGMVISKPGHLDRRVLTVAGLKALEGGHPLPTEASLEAGRRTLDLIKALRPDERLLVLISGGASSLVEVPIPGVGLDDLVRANRWLLGSGLAIDEVNGVRKALSLIKGGGLLRWLSGCSVRCLAISDVPGDDPSVIGSGLLVPDLHRSERLDGIKVPSWLRSLVMGGLQDWSGLPRVGPLIEVVANVDLAKQAIAEAARRMGIPVHAHPGLVTGDASERGRELGQALRTGAAGVHIWGGETTITLPANPGRGGRNQQLALAASQVLAGHQGCTLLSVGSDGTDGPTEDAGAVVDGGTLLRAGEAGLDVIRALAEADAGTLLEATGDLIHTGPTGTNVMDLILGYRSEGAD